MSSPSVHEEARLTARSLESSSSDASSTLPTLASFPRRVQPSPSVASSRTYATPRAHAAEVDSQTGHDFDWDAGPPETAEAWAFVRASIDRQERLQQAHIYALEDHVGTLKKTIAELEAAVHRQATELAFLPLEHRRVWDEEKKTLLQESQAKDGQIQRLQRDVEEVQKALATSSCTCPRANGVSGAPTYGDLEEELRATTERLRLLSTDHETKFETWRTKADELQARLTLAEEKSKEHEFVIANMEKDLKSRIDEVRRLRVELEEARGGGAAVQPGTGYHSAPLPANRSRTSVPAPANLRSQPPLPPPPLSKLETLGLPVGKPPGWDSSLGFRRY